MIIAAFLVLLLATLVFGAWLVVRLTLETARIDALIAADDRAQAVCDEAANAETACDYGGLL